jgi:hypothetical protein
MLCVESAQGIESKLGAGVMNMPTLEEVFSMQKLVVKQIIVKT